MKRTVAGEIEIGMPKRILTAGFSEAEHPREREDGGREVVEMMCRMCRQVVSKGRRGRTQKKGGTRKIIACGKEKGERR